MSRAKVSLPASSAQPPAAPSAAPTRFVPVERSVVMFQNEKKNPSHPDFRGKIVLQGVEYSFSVWAEQSRKNPSMTYYKGHVQPEGF